MTEGTPRVLRPGMWLRRESRHSEAYQYMGPTVWFIQDSKLLGGTGTIGWQTSAGIRFSYRSLYYLSTWLPVTGMSRSLSLYLWYVAELTQSMEIL